MGSSRFRGVGILAVLALFGAGCGGDAGGGEVAPPVRELAVGAAPEAAGGWERVETDSARLAAAFGRAGELPRLFSLIVARGGVVEGEQRFRGPALDAPTNVKSVSKSVLSALIGIAIAEGHLDGLHQPAMPFFAEHLRGDPEAAKSRITIEHLLAMQAGLEPTSFGNYGRWVSSPNWVRYVVTRPMVDEPGGRMLYSTGSSHLLSAILARTTGASTWSYARERLGAPLGISVPRWPADPQGIHFGGNEMRLSPRDLLRFGEMYRNGGRVDGRQVVPEAWVRESWRPRTRSPFNGYGYGLGWWIREAGGHPVYFAWGYGGQFVFVIPSLEMTVVATSDPNDARDGGHLRAVHDLIDRWIIPAADGATAGGLRSRPARS